MTKFKKIIVILTIVCLFIPGIFSKAQARIPKTLDGKENRFIHSDEETWSPCQDFRAGIAAKEWWLDNAGEIFTDNLFYYKQANLCFPSGLGTGDVTCITEEPGSVKVIVETYLTSDFKQCRPGPSGHPIAPFVDLSGQ
jgi:hypothetical protein